MIAALAHLWIESAGWAAVQATLVATLLILVEHPMRRWRPSLARGLVLLAMLKFAMPPWLAWGWGIPWQAPLASSIRIPPASPAGLVPVVGAIWIAGTLVALVLWIRARLGLLRECAAAEPARDPQLLLLLERAARRVGVAEPPRLLLSSRSGAPWVTGVVRPTIVLPSTWPGELDAGQLEDVLLHELAHVKRHDVATLELAAALGVVWWWNPVFHAIRGRWLAAVEEACDDHVLVATGGDARRYAAALLAGAKLFVSHPGPVRVERVAAGMRGGLLESRVRRMLSNGFRPTPRTARVARLAIAALALVVLPAAGRSTDRSWRVPAGHNGHQHAHGHLHPHASMKH